MAEYETDEGEKYKGDRKADKFAGKKSVAGKIREQRQGKKSALDRIMQEGGMTPSRQENPPQTGHRDHYNDDEDYN